MAPARPLGGEGRGERSGHLRHKTKEQDDSMRGGERRALCVGPRCLASLLQWVQAPPGGGGGEHTPQHSQRVSAQPAGGLERQGGCAARRHGAGGGRVDQDIHVLAKLPLSTAHEVKALKRRRRRPTCCCWKSSARWTKVERERERESADHGQRDQRTAPSGTVPSPPAGESCA